MAKPETYEVQQVLSREEWEGDRGTMVTYEILFANSEAKWKASVAADLDPGLKDGELVKGWKNPDNKFGIATGGGSPNGGQRRSAAPDAKFDRRPDHPRQEARAIHTSALSAASAYIEQALTINAVAQPKDWEEYWTLVEMVIGKLEATYTLPDRD